MYVYEGNAISLSFTHPLTVGHTHSRAHCWDVSAVRVASAPRGEEITIVSWGASVPCKENQQITLQHIK